MKIENIQCYGWESAIRGMRNPLNSWDRSDSTFENGIPALGPNDLRLATNLVKAGPEHGKWLRQVFVSMDITAPMYWWSEFDTYKVGTVANSTSKMHKLASTPITIDCFETDDMVPGLTVYGDVRSDRPYDIQELYEYIISTCNTLQDIYNQTHDIRYWKELLRILPESWLQTRTWTANYAVLRAMYHQRTGHKLTEWKTFLDTVTEQLPYSKEFIVDN